MSILLIARLSSLFSQTESNWQWKHPAPTGNTIRWCQMLDSKTWFMAGNGGTFIKTTDGGATWFINPSAGFSYPNNWSYDVQNGVFFDKDNGFIATSENLKRTTNGGVTFDTIPGSYGGWNSLCFPNSLTGYAVSSSGRAKTTDGGNTWVYIPAYPGSYIYSIDGIHVFILSSSDLIFRSTDGGSTWAQINTGSLYTLRKIKFLNNDTGFVCGSTGTVQMTTNGGFNWINRNSGLPLIGFSDIKVTRSKREVFITGTDINYIYKSGDLGNTWDSVRMIAPSQINMLSYPYLAYLSSDVLSEDSILTVGTYGLINTHFGNTITCHTYLIKYGTNADGRIKSIWAYGGNGQLWAVGDYGWGGNLYPGRDQIMYSPDGGISWSIQPTDPTAAYTNINSISMLDFNTGYVAGTAGVIEMTSTGGGKWLPVNSPTTNDINKIVFINSSTGWIFGTLGTIYKTTDGTNSWIHQTATGVSGTIIGASIIDENNGWFAGQSGTLCKTTDGGNNWTQSNANLGTATMYGIKMINSNTGYICGPSTARKTINGGNSWDTIHLPINCQCFSLDFIDASNGIITGFGGEILKTTDGGLSWVVYHTGTDDALYASLMITPDTMFAAGDQASVFKSPMGLTKILEWKHNVPVKYTLYQNYPNPFNPSTTIRFSLPKSGNINMKVYDITGKEVRTLLNNVMLNSGTGTITFDGGDISSGVYFYTLIADGNLIASKKMILLK